MVYIMFLYNTLLATLSFSNYTFLIVLKGMWAEFIIIFLCAYFISSKMAKRFAFKIVNGKDRQIAIIIMIQIFTVVSQVALASILGVYHGYGFACTIIYCRSYHRKTIWFAV